MTALVDLVLAAHGGVDRWREITSISAHRLFSGALWDIKQVSGIVDEGEVIVGIQEERASLSPFTAPELRTRFTPKRVEIETTSGEVVSSLDDPRPTFDGHVLETPWTHQQLAYFTGYAMWTYLTEPYSLTFPGVRAEEVGPWTENGRTWRRLAVTFPEDIATHSRDQVFYVDDNGLIPRRDYQVDIAGGSPAAHYASDHQEVGGIVVPSTRVIHVRGEDNAPIPQPVIVSIELSDIVVT